MKEAHDHVSRQHGQLDTFSIDLNQQVDHYIIQNDSFMKQREDSLKVSTENIRGLGLELEVMFTSYQKQSIDDTATLRGELNTKAKALEATMQKMLQDLLESSNKAIDSSSSTSTKFINKASGVTANGLQGISGGLDTDIENSLKSNQKMNALFKENTEMNSMKIHEIEDSRQLTDDIIENFSGAVDDKRCLLNSNVDSLVVNVDEAIRQSKLEVQKTSLTANTILQNITIATEDMNQTAGTAMDSFVTFIDSKGVSIQGDVKGFFITLDAYNTNQKHDITVVGDVTSKYGDDAQIIADVGTVPSAIYHPLGVLDRTEDHDAIRMKCKMLLYPAPLLEEPTEEDQLHITEINNRLLTVFDDEEIEGGDLTTTSDNEEEDNDEKEAMFIPDEDVISSSASSRTSESTTSIGKSSSIAAKGITRGKTSNYKTQTSTNNDPNMSENNSRVSSPNFKIARLQKKNAFS
jgi:hypothetical protein